MPQSNVTLVMIELYTTSKYLQVIITSNYYFCESLLGNCIWVLLFSDMDDSESNFMFLIGITQIYIKTKLL